MKHKKRVKDKYFSEELPSDDYSFKEVSVDDFESLDKYILDSPQVQQALGNTFQGGIETGDKEKLQKKQKRLLRKVLQAASQVLTDRQFQIFVLRFIFNLTEEEVAERLTREFIGRPRLDKRTKQAGEVKKISQPYVSQTTHVCIKKIQKALRLKDVPTEEEV